MTHPTKYLLRMLVFLALVAALVVFLFDPLEVAFANNVLLNGLIVVVLLFGVGWTLLQVARLSREVTWVETFQQQRARLEALPPPLLLAPMAQMMQSRVERAERAGADRGDERFTLSAPAMRSMLDGIASRLDEGRELSRYMIGLLIFLGLLGTFWGLLLTVRSISDVIGGMSVGSGDVSALFAQLKLGLARPLRGMGTAFSSSMLGLSGALVLGFLDLTAGQAQNRFFNELEEWLAGLTRLASGALADGDGSVPAYVQALLEQTAENMEGLQRVMARGEDSRREGNTVMLALSERLGTLSEQMRVSLAAGSGGDDEVSRAHLRNIELYLQRLLIDVEQGRTQSFGELRNDLRILTRTIAALAEDRPR
jgi:biopolymer transport protein ExbB/TolQ